LDDFFQHVVEGYHLDTKPELVNVKAKHFAKSQPKSCFRNAITYVLNHVEANYVLGFNILHGVPIEHAWVHEADGYYDVTVPEVKGDYYKLVEIPIGKLIKLVHENNYIDIDLYTYSKLMRKL